MICPFCGSHIKDQIHEKIEVLPINKKIREIYKKHQITVFKESFKRECSKPTCFANEIEGVFDKEGNFYVKKVMTYDQLIQYERLLTYLGGNIAARSF